MLKLEKSPANQDKLVTLLASLEMTQAFWLENEVRAKMTCLEFHLNFAVSIRSKMLSEVILRISTLEYRKLLKNIPYRPIVF